MLVGNQGYPDILASLHGLLLHAEVAHRELGIGGGCNGEVSIDVSNSAGLGAIDPYRRSHDWVTVLVDDGTGDRGLRQRYSRHQEQAG